MRHKTENGNWPDNLSDRFRDDIRMEQPDLDSDQADSGLEAGRRHRPGGASRPGSAADRKRKLEDFLDREDLSERIFTDRNWL